MLGVISALIPFLKNLPDAIQTQLAVLPYLAIVGTGVLGSVFRKYRFVYLAVVLGVAYWNLQITHAEQSPNSSLVDALYGVYFVINLVIINYLPEKRFFTIAGAGIFLSFITQLLFGKWLIVDFSEKVTGLLNYDLDLLIGFVNRTNLPTVVLLLYVAASVFLFLRYGKTRSVFESGFLGTLVATALMLNSEMTPPSAGMFMLAAGLIAMSALVQNSYFIAYIDELTELPGRRALNEELARLRGQYCIAMLDVDHFKKFNDTHGHDLGDQVLRMVAAKLGRVSGGGKAFRYGGEEFCIVFSSKDMKTAFPHLSAVRQSIDETRMIQRSKDRPKSRPDIIPKKTRKFKEVHVTISIGVAEKIPELEQPEDVLKAADKALYVAKEKGRNRISQYGIKLVEVPINT